MKDGRPGYAVTRRGKPIITKSRLGFLCTDARKLERGFGYVSQGMRDEDGSWDQPWGAWKTIRNHFREMRVCFQEKAGLDRLTGRIRGC